MSWIDVLEDVKAKLTNRDAAGLITFARDVYRTYVADPKLSLTTWDWYSFALGALGWSKPGDKFKVDTKHQLQPYPFAAELRAALGAMLTELDAQSVPYKPPRDVRGTDAVYRKLATEAWDAMKSLGHEASQTPELLRRLQSMHPDKSAVTTPTKREPEQVEMPLEAQPVGKPIKTPSGGASSSESSKGGGVLVVLAALAFGTKRKRRR